MGTTQDDTNKQGPRNGFPYAPLVPEGISFMAIAICMDTQGAFAPTPCFPAIDGSSAAHTLSVRRSPKTRRAFACNNGEAKWTLRSIGSAAAHGSALPFAAAIVHTSNCGPAAQLYAYHTVVCTFA